MKIKMLALVFAAIGALTTFNAVAHHSFAAEFDADSKLKISGTVIKVAWSNPHGYIFLEVEDDEGNYEEWGFEMGSPTALQRRGWKRDTLKVGTEVIVMGTRARDGSLKGNAQIVLISETCQQMFAGSSQRDFNEDAADQEQCEI